EIRPPHGEESPRVGNTGFVAADQLFGAVMSERPDHWVWLIKVSELTDGISGHILQEVTEQRARYDARRDSSSPVHLSDFLLRRLEFGALFGSHGIDGDYREFRLRLLRIACDWRQQDAHEDHKPFSSHDQSPFCPAPCPSSLTVTPAAWSVLE